MWHGPAQRPLAAAILFLSLDTTFGSFGFEKIEGGFLSFFASSLSIAVIIIGGFFLAKGVAGMEALMIRHSRAVSFAANVGPSSFEMRASVARQPCRSK